MPVIPGLPRQRVLAGRVPRRVDEVVAQVGGVGDLVERQLVDPPERDQPAGQPRRRRDDVGVDRLAAAEHRLDLGEVLVVVVERLGVGHVDAGRLDEPVDGADGVALGGVDVLGPVLEVQLAARRRSRRRRAGSPGADASSRRRSRAARAGRSPAAPSSAGRWRAAGAGSSTWAGVSRVRWTHRLFSLSESRLDLVDVGVAGAGLRRPAGEQEGGAGLHVSVNGRAGVGGTAGRRRGRRR